MSEPAIRTPKMRLDELLVARELAESRTLAKSMIMAGKVRSGTQILDKPGKEYARDLELVIEKPARFVSRGGDKLEGFLEQYALPLNHATVLDVGASTGGFTDCCLQRGAAHVTCVDVGYGQLHAKLRQDPRIKNLEKVNARTIADISLPYDAYDLVVMDLSFISLTKILPAAWSRVKTDGYLVALVKPQFEAGKKEVDIGKGVIRDAAVQQRVLNEIRQFCTDQLEASVEVGHITSPLKGADGNVEFLLGLKKVAN